MTPVSDGFPTDKTCGTAAIAALSSAHRESLAFLVPLSDDYPEISFWFLRKVVPGEYRGNRHILRLERDGRLAALGIAKNELGEKKICTVRVHPHFVGRGLGIRVFEHLLNWLQVDKPHLTVSKEKLPVFQRIFDHYGFVQSFAIPNMYREGSIELGYNEIRLVPSQQIQRAQISVTSFR